MLQDKLNSIGYNVEFTVKFTKVDGTERVITGYMEQPKTPQDYSESKPVPMKVTKGEAAGQWRSFKPENVVDITTEVE